MQRKDSKQLEVPAGFYVSRARTLLQLAQEALKEAMNRLPEDSETLKDVHKADRHLGIALDVLQ